MINSECSVYLCVMASVMLSCNITVLICNVTTLPSSLSSILFMYIWCVAAMLGFCSHFTSVQCFYCCWSGAGPCCSVAVVAQCSDAVLPQWKSVTAVLRCDSVAAMLPQWCCVASVMQCWLSDALLPQYCRSDAVSPQLCSVAVVMQCCRSDAVLSQWCSVTAVVQCCRSGRREGHAVMGLAPPKRPTEKPRPLLSANSTPPTTYDACIRHCCKTIL